MPPSDGKRTGLASYSWGGWGTQNDLTQFRDVFQPGQGIFSPSYPLVPPERDACACGTFRSVIIHLHAALLRGHWFRRAQGTGRTPRHHPTGDRNAKGPG